MAHRVGAVVPELELLGGADEVVQGADILVGVSVHHMCQGARITGAERVAEDALVEAAEGVVHDLDLVERVSDDSGRLLADVVKAVVIGGHSAFGADEDAILNKVVGLIDPQNAGVHLPGDETVDDARHVHLGATLLGGGGEAHVGDQGLVVVELA